MWSRFEAVANRCFAEMPYYSVCLHDRRRLPAEVLDAAARTHPFRWDGHAPVPAAAYQDPWEFVRAAQPAFVKRPPGAAVTTVTTSRQARAGLDALVPHEWRARLEDVRLAASELVTNALREAGRAQVASWTQQDTLVLEVSDTGGGLPDPLRGYVDPRTRRRAAGACGWRSASRTTRACAPARGAPASGSSSGAEAVPPRPPMPPRRGPLSASGPGEEGRSPPGPPAARRDGESR